MFWPFLYSSINFNSLLWFVSRIKFLSDGSCIYACLCLNTAPSQTVYWSSSPGSCCWDVFFICSAATGTHIWSQNQGWSGKFKCLVMLANWDIGLCLSGFLYNWTELMANNWVCSFTCEIILFSMAETSSSPSEWC